MKNTVLFTGASAGLGEEFAWQLASQGYNLLLVARRTEKLALLQKQLAEKYPLLHSSTLTTDLNEHDAIEHIQTFIEVKNIQLIGLINNAGFATRGQFTELSIIRQQEMLQVNMIALTLLTHASMHNLKKEKDSFITDESPLI